MHRAPAARRRNGRRAGPLLVAAFVALGCSGATSDDETGAERSPLQTPPDPPQLKGFDPAVELAHLQGRWLVKAGYDGVQSTWIIEGNTVVSTLGDKATAGRISIRYPGSLAFSGNNTFAYARDGETLWLGHGVGGAKRGKDYYVGAGFGGQHGLVHFDGERCTYQQEKVGRDWAHPQLEAPTQVRCRVDGDTFAYQVPKFMKPGVLEDKTVTVVGEALLNYQLRSAHQIVRAPALGPPKAPPPR